MHPVFLMVLDVKSYNQPEGEEGPSRVPCELLQAGREQEQWS